MKPNISIIGFIYINNDDDSRQTAEAEDLVILNKSEIWKGKNRKIRTIFFVAYEISIDVVDNMANLDWMNSMAFQGFSNLMIQNTANKTIKLLQ